MTAMHIPSSDGVLLAVHDLGGDGPDLLLAHANGFHGRVWDPMVEALGGFHVWSVDLRAHGDSPLPDGVNLDWAGFADDVLAVIDTLGLHRPFGVGHSLGGAAELLAEERRPGTFRALWCFEPVIVPPALMREGPTPDNPLSAGARRRRERFDSVDAAVANYASKPPFAALDPRALRAYVEHGFSQEADGSIRLKCSREHEAEIFAIGPTREAFVDLGSVACPVTVAVGDRDAPGPAAFAPAVVDALPQGHLQEFPSLGHFGPLEAPEAMALAVRQAFAGL
jgi:pimeloyl-ACP methyl ester carboxylesterase